MRRILAEGVDDLRYSAHSFMRTPGLALALLLTIALGVGANAAVYGFIRGLISPQLPVPESERLVSIFTRDKDGALLPVSFEHYDALRTGVEVFDSLGLARESRTRIALGGRASTVIAAELTPALASLLGLSLSDGVLISERRRASEFGEGGDVSGKTVHLNGAERRITGVAPEWLVGLYSSRPVDVWTALDEDTIPPQERQSLALVVIGRLRSGIVAEDAQKAVAAAGGEGLAVLRYRGITPEAAAGMARLATLLPAAAATVFFIACANVAAFLLARASARVHETSVRVALGASRPRLARQMLADSVLLSTCGGIIGLLLAYWTVHLVPAFLYDIHAAELIFSPDARTIAGALVAFGVLVACGMVPLVETRHDKPAAVLQREAGGPSVAMLRVRSALVLGQMAGCCMLLISTGLLFEAFRSALHTNAGGRLGEPILAFLETAADRPDLGLAYFGRAEAAALALPGVSETALVDRPPGAVTAWTAVRIEPPDLPLQSVRMDVIAFTPRSLNAVVLPPLAGRMFGGLDTPHSCRVVLVNEEAASAVFDGNAVGRVMQDPAGEHVEIIGVVRTRQATAPRRPSVLYYAGQSEPPPVERGSGVFRVPRPPAPEAHGVLDTRVVSPGYFRTMDLPVVDGGTFDDEVQRRGCRVGVLNEEAAQLYFAGHAVGGAIIDSSGSRTEILGVVRSPPLRSSQRRTEPSIYFPIGQNYTPRMTLILGARTADDDTVRLVRERLQGVAGGSPRTVLTLDEQLARTALAPERIAATLVGAAAVTALTLAVLGIYGATAELARQRRREFALRIALGAQRWRVAVQVLIAGFRLAATGILAGVLGSILIAKWLAQIAPGVGLSLGWIWIASPALLLLAVALASIIPARRAKMANPLSLMQDK